MPAIRVRNIGIGLYHGRSHGPQRHSRALSVAVVGGGISPLSGDFAVDF